MENHTTPDISVSKERKLDENIAEHIDATEPTSFEAQESSGNSSNPTENENSTNEAADPTPISKANEKIDDLDASSIFSLSKPRDVIG